jgi:hypothetical protein
MCKGLLSAVAIASSLFPQIAVAENPLPTPWQIRKCQIYKAAWEDLPMLMSTGSFSPQFKTLNETFIESGCLAHIAICPQGQQEIDAANLLTIAAMNGGTASTFLPFRC